MKPLSGPTNKEGLAYLQGQPDIAISAAASHEEDFAVTGLRAIAATSKSKATTMRVLHNAGHGAPMFAADPSLLPAIVEWVTAVLR